MNGCPWNCTWTCKRATENGHLYCLKYACENGCRWNVWTCRKAAEKGHLGCLKYAHKHGCPWDARACALATTRSASNTSRGKGVLDFASVCSSDLVLVLTAWSYQLTDAPSYTPWELNRATYLNIFQLRSDSLLKPTAVRRGILVRTIVSGRKAIEL